VKESIHLVQVIHNSEQIWGTQRVGPYQAPLLPHALFLFLYFESHYFTETAELRLRRNRGQVHSRKLLASGAAWVTVLVAMVNKVSVWPIASRYTDCARNNRGTGENTVIHWTWTEQIQKIISLQILILGVGTSRECKHNCSVVTRGCSVEASDVTWQWLQWCALEHLFSGKLISVTEACAHYYE
jgi:hypothetical protein